MKILLVENHVVFADLVTRQFLAAHEVVAVPTLSAARSALLVAQFDAFLVDFDLDDGKGDVLVRELVAQKLPGRIIAISSHDAGNTALLRAGAHACCPKGRFREIGPVLAATTLGAASG